MATESVYYDPVADGDPLGDGWAHHENQYLYFAVDDLEAAREAAIEAGCSDVGPIEAMPWGETLFYARDTSGNPICLVDSTTCFMG